MAKTSSRSSSIARALVGQASPVMWEPGLEIPPEMQALKSLNSVAAGMGAGQMGGQVAKVLAGMSQIAPRVLASQAGAIFPEGAGIPKGREAIKEYFDILPEMQKNYRTNEALHQFHSEMMDWPRVMQDKWALLKNHGGN
jgi:hypothetical protein